MGGGRQFLGFMGEHSCYEGGHIAHGEPPQSPLLRKTLKVHTQSAMKYLYPPESFIIITCVLFTTYVRYWKRLPDNSLKLKELFLLRSFHMVKVPFFQALVLMSIPIFLIQDYLQYPV